MNELKDRYNACNEERENAYNAFVELENMSDEEFYSNEENEKRYNALSEKLDILANILHDLENEMMNR